VIEFTVRVRPVPVVELERRRWSDTYYRQGFERWREAGVARDRRPGVEVRHWAIVY
jgi:hypothetical protein